MKDEDYKKKKKRENARYKYAREHWAKFDTDVLKSKSDDIAFMVYDYISALALRDELESRRDS